MNEKKKSHFWLGALCGALAMFILANGVLVYAEHVMGQSYAIESTQKDGTASASTGTSGVEGKLKILKALIDQKFLYGDDVTDEQLADGIYKGYVDALGDKYSVYYNEEETKKMKESTSGEYSGIGVVFSQNIDTKISTAVQVYENSPAEESGMKADDILYKVDGEEIAGMDLSEIVQKIRGQEGTNVTITVLRGEDYKEIDIPITRRKIEVQTVKYSMLEDQIGYLRITEFDDVTESQFNEAFDALETAGMKGLVIDLRSNPGGSVAVVTKILDRLLPEGTIVYTRDKNGKETYFESDAENDFNKPLAVLVNANSASASEIFSGAIQDYGKGPIVGTTTYGKGIVQQLIDLYDGTMLKITISEYFTPNGRNIHGTGITPDVEVEYQKDESNPDADNQLDKAVEEVKKKL